MVPHIFLPQSLQIISCEHYLMYPFQFWIRAFLDPPGQTVYFSMIFSVASPCRPDSLVDSTKAMRAMGDPTSRLDIAPAGHMAHAPPRARCQWCFWSNGESTRREKHACCQITCAMVTSSFSVYASIGNNRIANAALAFLLWMKLLSLKQECHCCRAKSKSQSAKKIRLKVYDATWRPCDIPLANWLQSMIILILYFLSNYFFFACKPKTALYYQMHRRLLATSFSLSLGLPHEKAAMPPATLVANSAVQQLLQEEIDTNLKNNCSNANTSMLAACVVFPTYQKLLALPNGTTMTEYAEYFIHGCSQSKFLNFPEFMTYESWNGFPHTSHTIAKGSKLGVPAHQALNLITWTGPLPPSPTYPLSPSPLHLSVSEAETSGTLARS